MRVNNFFDPSTSSMRKGRNGGGKNRGEKGGKKKENNDVFSGH